MLNSIKKLKSIVLTLLLVLLAFSAVACRSTGGGQGGNQGGSNNGGNNSGNNGDVQGGDSQEGDLPDGTPGLIFNSTSNLTVVLADNAFPSGLSNDFVWALKDNLGSRLGVKYDDSEAASEHEIILGQSNRVATHLAYSRLEDIMYDQGAGFGGYVLYSDGASLALAYTEELGTQHLEDIMADLTAWAELPALAKEKGVVSAKVYNMYEIYAEEDKIRQDAQWQVVEQKLGAESTAALKELYYQVYDGKIVSWLANLYEPRECICENYVDGVRVCLHPTDADGNDLCKNGGFYYSNSARNTYGFLPDVESTYQALTFMEMTGMLDNYGGSFSYISDQLRADIVAFTKGLQHEDGYFYHPQWTVEASRANWSRVSRDLMWATAILQKFETRPYYTTPTGKLTGTGGRPAAAAHLTERLSSDSVSGVSKVVSAASALPEHLQSVEAFKAYLEKFTMDVYGQGYYAANELAAQVEQLKVANEQLGGALKPILFEFFEEKHNPENGLWREETDYDGLNTVFKAVMVYSTFKMPFTYAEQAAESAIYVLSSSEVPGHVCGTYNTWYDIAGLISNIRAYHTSENRAEIADGILARIREIAPDAIRNTTKNTLIFKKSDGSFSYFADHCSETSQGMVVALRCDEGDVNASLICSGGLLDHMGMALGVDLPSIFGTKQLAEFLDIIESNGYSIKDSLPPDVIADFEDGTVDVESSSVGASNGSGGSTVVALDPQNPKNQVLHFTSLAKSGTWDSVTIPNNTFKVNVNSLVFEGKFMFEKEGTSQGYLIQMYLGYMNKATPYFINFTVAGDYVQVWEASSDNMNNSFDRLLGKFKLDEWFKLRIEYYFGYEDVEKGITPHDSVRIKIYTNDTLVAVSSNYMDNTMSKFLNGTGTPVDEAKQVLIFPMSYYACNMYLDDLYFGYKNIEYKSEKNTKGLIVNEDAEFPREEYGFDDGALPEEIVITGDAKTEVADGALKFKATSGSTTVAIPANSCAPLPNVFAVGFDISATQAKVGTVFTVRIKDPYKSYTIVSYTMRCAEVDGVLCLVPLYKEQTLITSAAIPLDGETHHLEFAFFVDAAATLIYKDGEMIASTEQGVLAKHYLYEMGRAEIVYTGSAELSIDNVYCEKRVGDFDEETKPKIDRIEVNFGSGNIADMDNITTDGRVEGGMLNIAGGYVTVAANERSPYVSAYELSADMNTSSYNTENPTYVRFLDANGNTVIGVAMVEKAGVMYFYEMLNDDKYGAYVGACEYGGGAKFKFVFYANEKVLEVYVGATLVLVTGQLNSEYDKIVAAKISSSSARVNNIYLDGMTLTYTAPKVDASTKDDTDEVITYDYSSLGNYPSRITTKTSSTESSSLEYVERDGELTKALVYKKHLSNYGNGVMFDFGDGQYKGNFVFETDIKLAGGFIAGDWKSNFDLYFANQSGGTHMFILQFRVSGGRLLANLYDGKTQLTKYDCGAITADDWVNIRTEVSAGDRTTNEQTGARLTLYVNGVEIYSGTDFVGSYDETATTAISGVYQVMLVPLTNVTGTLYIDNSIIKSN